MNENLINWQIEHIKEGIRQAEAGEYASEEEVRAAFEKWRKKPEKTLDN